MYVAAPLALDLDERPMPEAAHYPRRRPRPRARQRPSTAPGAMQTVGSPLSVEVTPSSGERVVDEEEDGEGQDEEEDGQEMDHLPPPPRRPPIMRSLSSVDQARRLGIQL